MSQASGETGCSQSREEEIQEKRLALDSELQVTRIPKVELDKAYSVEKASSQFLLYFFHALVWVGIFGIGLCVFLTIAGVIALTVLRFIDQPDPDPPQHFCFLHKYRKYSFSHQKPVMANPYAIRSLSGELSRLTLSHNPSDTV